MRCHRLATRSPGGRVDRVLSAAEAVTPDLHAVGGPVGEVDRPRAWPGEGCVVAPTCRHLLPVSGCRRPSRLFYTSASAGLLGLRRSRLAATRCGLPDNIFQGGVDSGDASPRWHSSTVSRIACGMRKTEHYKT